MWSKFITIVFLLSFTTGIISISPLYYLSTTFFPLPQGGDVVAFNELNLDTSTLTSVFKALNNTNDEYTNELFGVVIYYKTGALYGNYWKEYAPGLRQSYLLGIDTVNSKLLFKDFAFCEGFVSSGLGIDQTNGDIHFLNHSAVFQSSGLTVDWTKWNAEQNITTIVQAQANTNADAYGGLVYNSLTSTLWSLEYPSLTAYNINQSIIVYKDIPYWDHLTINPKTGELYATTGRGVDQLEIISINYNTTNVWGKLVCRYTAYGYSFATMPDSADFDYVSNTWVIALDEASSEKYGGPYNSFFYVDIETCDGKFSARSSADNKIFQGSPRFNSGVPS